MLFCPSFTQSERFLHTDQLITRLRRVEPATCESHDKLHSHVVGKRDRERVQVICSNLEGSDLPHLAASRGARCSPHVTMDALSTCWILHKFGQPMFALCCTTYIGARTNVNPSTLLFFLAALTTSLHQHVANVHRTWTLRTCRGEHALRVRSSPMMSRFVSVRLLRQRSRQTSAIPMATN